MLKEKRVLITGASGGIGAAIAKTCAAYGAVVFAGFSTGKERAEELCREIRQDGHQAEAIYLDVTQTESIQAAVGSVVRAGARVDALVNCAGIHIAGPLLSLSSEEIENQLKTNLEGTIRLTQAALIPMVRVRGGAILNISSVAAHRVTRGHAVYSATKAGLEGFTRALASEVAKRGIRVNCLVPGPVMTKMLAQNMEETGDDPAARVPLGRVLDAQEVAEAAAFLLSDRASGITGVVLPVDGGYSLW